MSTTPNDAARPVEEKVQFVCLECAYSGSDWKFQTDWESGHTETIRCGRCGSVDTDDIDNTDLSAIAETIKSEREAFDALRSEVERLRVADTYAASIGRGMLNEIRELRARAEAAEARVAKLVAFASHVRETAFDFVNEGIRPQEYHMRNLAWCADTALNAQGESNG